MRTANAQFRLLWSRHDSRRWYKRDILAVSYEEAAQKLVTDLAANKGVALEDFTVDHLVQEFEPGPFGQQRGLHSLRHVVRPFSVFFKNHAWAPQEHIPE